MSLNDMWQELSCITWPEKERVMSYVLCQLSPNTTIDTDI